MYYDKLPHFVYIKDEKFIINADYRTFIKFEEEMQGKDLNSAVMEALFNFYPAFNLIIEKDLLNEAVDKFIWFYSCGKEHINKPSKKSKIIKTGQVFSYKHDSDLIWSAFWMYGNRIDLTKDKLHWWKFRAIWNSLPSECEFVKIKSYRAYDGKDKDMLELKEYYKLPPTEAEIKDQVRRNKIYEALK